MIIVCDRIKDRETGLQMYKMIFTRKYKFYENFYVENLLYNFQFFIKYIEENNKNEFIDLFQGYIQFLLDNNFSLKKYDFLSNKCYIDIGFSKYLSEIKKNFSEDECKNSKKILFYTGYCDKLWNYTYSFTNALGGSETAIAQLAMCFPKDYDIYIVGLVKEETINNIKYVHLDNVNNLFNENAFHTVIISRYLDFFENYNVCYNQVFIWAHDVILINSNCRLSTSEILIKWNDKITGCICQTPWHENLFKNMYPLIKDKIQNINNGIITDLFIENPIKRQNRFIYTSCTERGLKRLLELWDSIVSLIPDAELIISTYNHFPRDDEERKMEEYIKKTTNIKHLGTLNKKDLYELMSTAEYWVYPSLFNETSCITSMEMLASGVICFYYPVAGLVNTLGDYGFKMEEGKEIGKIMEVVNMPEERKEEIKKIGKEYSRTCSWSERTKMWCNTIFNNNENDNSEDYKIQNLLYISSLDLMPPKHRDILQEISVDFTPKVIYDIGAAALHWTKIVREIWKDVDIIVFDAIKHAKYLYEKEKVKYFIGVLSNEDDKIVKFYENFEQVGGNSYYKEIGHPNSEILFPEDGYTEQKTRKISSVVKENNFSLPDIVKIDVQGCELDILKGGIDIINNAKYLIIELQHTEYNRGAPLAPITIKYLKENGWELLKERFVDNGPDADYLFKRGKIE
jgi:FkbM family methyltransferase